MSESLGGRMGGGGRMTHTRYGCACFQHGDELVRDRFFEVNLLLHNGIRVCRIPHSDPVNGQRRIALLRRISHRRILIPVVSIRIPQPEPIEVILRNAGHEKLDYVTAIRNDDLRLAIACCDGAGEGGWDARVDGACVAEDGLDEGGDGGGVAVVEAYGDGEDFVGGGGGEGDAKIGAIWIGEGEMGSEEGGEDERGFGERLPDGRNGVRWRHSDCSRGTAD